MPTPAPAIADPLATSRGDLATYEGRLLRETSYAMAETGRFFEGHSAVHRALRRIADRLDQLDIPYAVVGGMALSAHGYVRATDDVDLLVTAESLKRIHEELEGLGYLPPFAGSRHLRDTQEKVKVEFLVTGQYPGDGKEKPLAFPNPAAVAVERDGIQYVNLPTLIDLKLGSGMTNAGRLKDFSDVQELIRHLRLDEHTAEQLHGYVREKYLELLQTVRDNPEDDGRW